MDHLHLFAWSCTFNFCLYICIYLYCMPQICHKHPFFPCFFLEWGLNYLVSFFFFFFFFIYAVSLTPLACFKATLLSAPTITRMMAPGPLWQPSTRTSGTLGRTKRSRKSGLKMHISSPRYVFLLFFFLLLTIILQILYQWWTSCNAHERGPNNILSFGPGMFFLFSTNDHLHQSPFVLPLAQQINGPKRHWWCHLGQSSA